jgi:DNA-binding NarL/FixJ family response regulator
MISIVIVDNHKIVREGIKSLLGNQKDIEVVGDADFGNALPIMRAFQPKILLLSLISNGNHDINTTMRELCSASPLTQFLILARSVDDHYMLQALRSGALGCLISDSTVDDMVASIYELAQGGSFLPSAVGKRLIEGISHSNGKSDGGATTLTQQQFRVLKYICHGYTNLEIASLMVISKRTVEMHTYRLFKQLNVSNRSQAIQTAMRMGLLEMNDFSKEEGEVVI